MRTNKERRPAGRPEVKVEVQRRRSDRAPMTVEIERMLSGAPAGMYRS